MQQTSVNISNKKCPIRICCVLIAHLTTSVKFPQCRAKQASVVARATSQQTLFKTQCLEAIVGKRLRKMLLNGKALSNSTKIGKQLAKDVGEFPPMEKLNWLIHLQHVRGEIASCKELINGEMARSHGKNEYAFFKQGVILKSQGNILEALDTFQKCLKLNQKNANILKEVASCLYEMGRYRLSLNALLEAEKLSKNPDWNLDYLIAKTYVKLGNSQKAKEYAHKSVKVGKQEESYALLIRLLVGEKDFASAIAVGNAAAEFCPDSVQLLTESGLLYLKTGQTQHAFERLSQALALDPACSKALLGIGCITHRHEDFEVALTKYKIAVLYEPESVALWNNIGLCFYSKQKYIAGSACIHMPDWQAISCLKRGLWISPLNWKILYNLALVHLATNQPASGFNFACAAVNLRPDVGDCFALLGCKYVQLLSERLDGVLRRVGFYWGDLTGWRLKDTENALRALKQALVLMPSDVSLLANGSLMLELLGFYEESEDFFNKFKVLIDEGHQVSNEILSLMDRLLVVQSSRAAEQPPGASVENSGTEQMKIRSQMQEDEV
ncbi:hypothetical protein HUJ05_007210 [Dendroctonus ponderosae]|nr:hypothetical protein HUJ05_007210 [Dendroctonus ponderosae]